MVEENARDVPAWSSSRTATVRQTIATALEKLQSALQKSGMNRATTQSESTAEPGGLELSTETRLYAVRYLSVDPVLSGYVVQMGRVQYGPWWL